MRVNSDLPASRPACPVLRSAKGRPMLTLCDAKPGLSRRGFLTVGALGLAGLPLSSLLPASEHRPGLLSGKSVVLLFQQGGPSQLETFDPKPDAPEGVRTVNDTIRTSL